MRAKLRKIAKAKYWPKAGYGGIPAAPVKNPNPPVDKTDK